MAIDPALQALIDADPIYSQGKTDADAATIAEKAQRNQSLMRALEEFGQIPDLTGSAAALGLDQTDLSQIATPEAQALAAANTNAGTSTLAQMNLTQALANRGITNNLGSRNMLRTGDTGYLLNQQGQQGTIAQYNARKQLLDYLAGIQSGFAAAQRQRQADLYGLFNDAYGRVLAAYPNGLPGTGTGAGTGAPSTGTGGDTSGGAHDTGTGEDHNTADVMAPSTFQAWINPSSLVVTPAGAPAANYGPAGPGFGSGYTQNTNNISTTRPMPIPPPPPPKPYVGYNPYGVAAGANIHR
jgi:hypothetical protein